MVRIHLNGKISAVSMGCMMAAALVGCASKIDCNDADAKKNAVSIIQSHLNTAVWYQEMGAAISGEPSLSDIKTLTRNDDIGSCQCSAKYLFTYNGKPREIAATYSLAFLQDKKSTEVKVDVNSIKAGFMSIVMAEAPVKNGVENRYNAAGKLIGKTVWKNNSKEGVEELYDPSTNKPLKRITWSNGKKVGPEKQWDSTGEKLLVDLIWQDGNANGFEKMYDATGKKILVDLVWKDGKATGLMTEGYSPYVTDPNSLVGYYEYHLKDGLKDGVANRYYAKSQELGIYLGTVENYKNGKPDGVVQELDKEGKVISETRYKDGVEISRQ